MTPDVATADGTRYTFNRTLRRKRLLGCGLAALTTLGIAAGVLVWTVFQRYDPGRALLIEVPLTENRTGGLEGSLETVLPEGQYLFSARFTPEGNPNAVTSEVNIGSTADDAHRTLNVVCSADSLSQRLEEYSDWQRIVSDHRGSRLLPYPWTHVSPEHPASAVWHLWPIYDIRGAAPRRRDFTFHCVPTKGELPRGQWHFRIERYIDAI